MNYPLENLGPDRFQMLCQALLVLEEPGVVCYPVGMPDGGRDAMKKVFSDEDSFVVFQVKFAKSLNNDESANRKWILEAAKGEAEKAARLKARGASKYVFITNAQGTAHLGSGSMDKLEVTLAEIVQMPVVCWWRDDISRRLDGNWDLKLRYPEVLTGQDFLRLLFERNQSEDQARRVNALKAFLGDQYQEDQEVKFKQVELQNKLLDLFVDLPFSVDIHEASAMGSFRGLLAKGFDVELSEQKNSIRIEDVSDGVGTGTASLLLSELAGEALSQIVIEGAPGQGKSTLAQYLCQVHRIRILDKKSDFELLPVDHRLSPVFIPFKVDLRDVAEWLSGVDPFQSESGSTHHIERTVEAFLARLVEHKAGGIKFTVNDLIELAKQTPLFIAFDGLDEVADIKRRSDVVAAVSKSLNRMRENCRTMRVIVTSRPAAFANSPGFEHQLFPYLQLGSVKRSQIESYAAKWLDARGLTSKERLEFEAVLGEKIDEPHLRDLSRNPMQLAILLSLIHTKGAALPDKRTALYDSYVDLFFGRESTKNAVVRQNLDLLKDIHRYLAWVLHSRAEVGNVGARVDGRLTSKEMRSVLQDYLTKEHRSTAVIDEIFQAMLERVVMIVSRIEGTHEFEVQPLREYFAARYLYDTASYSPPGREKSGTKPDRFDAIAQNPYWLNVLRFFCGCFSKGELLDLADRIKGLSNQSAISQTRRPAQIASMLLQDWVFTQSPKASNEVTQSLLNRVAIRKLLPAEIRYRHEEPIRLPYAGGGREISLRAFEYLMDKDTPWDIVERLARLVIYNLPTMEAAELWTDAMPYPDDHFEHWLNAGYCLNTLDSLSSIDVGRLIGSRQLSVRATAILWQAGHAEALGTTVENAASCINYALTRPSFWRQSGDESPFYLLPMFCRSIIQSEMYAGMEGFELEIVPIIRQFSGISYIDCHGPNLHLEKFSRLCFEMSKAVSNEVLADPNISESLDLWFLIVDRCHKVFGDAPIVINMAIAAFSLGSNRKGRSKKAWLFDKGQSIVARLSYAKSQSKKATWWDEVIGGATTDEERIFLSALIWLWAPSNVIIDRCSILAFTLDQMSVESWTKFHNLVGQRLTSRSSSVGKAADELPFQTKSYRYAYLMSQRENKKYSRLVFLNYFVEFSDTSPEFASFRSSHAIEAASQSQISWQTALKVIKSAYRTNTNISGRFADLPQQIVDEILANPQLYPASMWDRAQALILSRSERDIRPVSLIAKRDKWFVE